MHHSHQTSKLIRTRNRGVCNAMGNIGGPSRSMRGWRSGSVGCVHGSGDPRWVVASAHVSSTFMQLLLIIKMFTFKIIVFWWNITRMSAKLKRESQSQEGPRQLWRRKPKRAHFLLWSGGFLGVAVGGPSGDSQRDGMGEAEVGKGEMGRERDT